MEKDVESFSAAEAVLDVRAFGARGDGVSLDSPSFSAAFAAAANRGGGTVRVRPGHYLCGSLRIPSNVTLHLDAGAVILGSSDPAHYPVLPCQWEGERRDVHIGLICAIDAENLAVTGRGTIDGQGASWWTRFRERNLDFPRPRLVHFIRCRNVLLSGVTLTQSAAWTVNPFECENVTIHAVTIRNPPNSPNTDGINPESCARVRISDCDIDVGDDCITLKAGSASAGDGGVHKPCESIVVTNCTMTHGHGGVVIGSEMSGGVRDVAVSNCVFRGTDRGIRIKTCRTRGGRVENVRFANITMREVGHPIVMHMFYRFGVPAEKVEYASDRGLKPVDAGTPCIRGIHIQGVSAEAIRGVALVFLYGLPEMPISDVSMADMALHVEPGVAPTRKEPAMLLGRPPCDPVGIWAANVERLRVSGASLCPPCGGPAMKLQGVRSSSFSGLTVDGRRLAATDVRMSECEGVEVQPN